MQIMIVSGFWFCRRSRRRKINMRWTLVYFRKSHVRGKKLDVQETDFSFTQFYRSWNNFSRCRFTHGWNSSSWSSGFGHRSVSLFTKPTQQHQRSSTRKLVAWYHIKQAHPQQNQGSNQAPQFWSEQCWLCAVEREVFSVQWRWDTYPETKELLLIGYSTEFIWTAKIQIKYVDTKHFTRDEWNNLLYLFRSAISAISAALRISVWPAALRISVWPAAPKRWRKGCRNRKETTGSWQSQSRRRWTWPPLSRPVLRLWTVRLRRKPGDTQSTLSNTWRKRSQSRRSVEFSRMTKRCISGREHRETCRDRRKPGTSESLQDIQDIQDIQELQETQKTRKPKAMTKIGHTISIFHQMKCCMEKVFSILRQRYGRSPTDQMKDLDVKHCKMENMYVCQSSSCSSSWDRLHGKSAICQESTLETVMSSDWEVDQGADRNYWTGHAWLTAAYVQRDYSVNWQSCSICNCQNLRLFWLSAISGTNRLKTGKAGFNGFWKTVTSKIWIGSTKSR